MVATKRAPSGATGDQKKFFSRKSQTKKIFFTLEMSEKKFPAQAMSGSKKFASHGADRKKFRVTGDRSEKNFATEGIVSRIMASPDRVQYRCMHCQAEWMHAWSDE